MKNITIIGSGTMGNGIAHAFAQSGYYVNLVDISNEALAKAINTIEKNLERMLVKEKITVNEKKQTLNNIKTYTNLNKAIANTDLVIEAATENIQVKLKIFKELDSICNKETILASNTSSISITTIANCTKRSEKVIGMHFMNPVPVMKLVEVIRGKNTSNDVTKIIMDLSKKLNKIPVEVNDSPGFVANRILMPMINEAILTLEEGVSGIHEIDTVMKLGMSHPMGPLQLADFIGLDVCLSILDIMCHDFKNKKYKPCDLLKKMVKNNQLGVKTKEGFYDYRHGLKSTKLSSRFCK